MSEQRQNAVVRPNGRVTRGFSNLPKEQSQQEESSSEEVESSSKEVPVKNKKIHHMTLKALERKKKLAEQGHNSEVKKEDSVAQKVEKPPARKRGRPRGSRRVERQDREDYQVDLSEESVSENSEQIQEKREIFLRKRDRAKKMLQEDSHQIQEVKSQKQAHGTKHLQVSIELSVVPEAQIEKRENEGTVSVVAPPAPKKRGRKKKVQPEMVAEVVQPQPAVPHVKIFTVPKAQTYDNYHKYYAKIIEETKQSQKPEMALIFDRFSDPSKYQQFIGSLKQ